MNPFLEGCLVLAVLFGAGSTVNYAVQSAVPCLRESSCLSETTDSDKSKLFMYHNVKITDSAELKDEIKGLFDKDNIYNDVCGFDMRNADLKSISVINILNLPFKKVGQVVGSCINYLVYSEGSDSLAEGK